MKIGKAVFALFENMCDVKTYYIIFIFERFCRIMTSKISQSALGRAVMVPGFRWTGPKIYNAAV